MYTRRAAVNNSRLFPCHPSGGRGAGRAAATTDEGSSSGSRTPLLGEGLLGVFDLKQNKWLQPQVTGQGPCPRSSARAVALPDRIVIYGGAAQGGLVECCLGSVQSAPTHVDAAMVCTVHKKPLLWVPVCHVQNYAATCN
jgi:hypothetical protein